MSKTLCQCDFTHDVANSAFVAFDVFDPLLHIFGVVGIEVSL